MLMNDDMAEIRAIFRRKLGREPTDQEIETVRPLWNQAGYSDQDVIWDVVILFTAQFGASHEALRRVEELSNGMVEKLDEKLAQMIPVVKRASDPTRYIRWMIGALIANVLGVSIAWVWFEYQEKRQVYDLYRVARVEAVRDLKYLSDVLGEFPTVLETPLGKAVLDLHRSGYRDTFELVEMIRCYSVYSPRRFERLDSGSEAFDYCRFRDEKEASQWKVARVRD